MIEALRSNHVRTLRANGLPLAHDRRACPARRRCCRSSPISDPAAAALLTGSVVVETIFGIPGVGRYFVDGALNRDYTLVMGTVILSRSSSSSSTSSSTSSTRCSTRGCAMTDATPDAVRLLARARPVAGRSLWADCPPRLPRNRAAIDRHRRADADHAGLHPRPGADRHDYSTRSTRTTCRSAQPRRPFPLPEQIRPAAGPHRRPHAGEGGGNRRGEGDGSR